MGSPRGGNEFSDLERRLRAERAEPSARLQQEVTDLTSAAPKRPQTRSKLVLAGGLTAALLATAAVLGASTAAQVSSSAAQSEYGERVIICHYPDGLATGVTLRLSDEGAKAHVAEHARDTAGPCP